jgi:hypothetical protein
MENIIRKSIEGGFVMKNIILKDGQLFAFGRMETQTVYNEVVLNPLFWQALGKVMKNKLSGWEVVDNETMIKHALKFHEINLTEGWSKAVEWLETLIKE